MKHLDLTINTKRIHIFDISILFVKYTSWKTTLKALKTYFRR